MRIFLLGNSQSTSTGVRQGESFPALLRASLGAGDELHLLAMSGWSIADFATHLENVTLLDPGVVVLQVGIVEASRRILSEREKRMLARLPRSRVITKWLHDRRQKVILMRHRLGLDTRLFTVEEFERRVDDVVRRLRETGAQVIVLEIPYFGDEYERRHFPLINEDARLFNKALAKHGAVPLVAPADDLETIYQAGTVHFTELGHQRAAARLREYLAR